MLLRPSEGASAAQVERVKEAVVEEVRKELGSEAESGFVVATTAL